MWIRRSEYPVTSRSPGRRRRRHPVQFASTSRLSMPPEAMRRMMAGMGVDRAAAAIGGNRPNKPRLPNRRRPGVAELTSTGNIDQGHIIYYRASKKDCSICSLKPKCTTAIVRKVTRDLNEDMRDRVRALASTEAFQQSSRERKKVEMRFAHM